jgi:hypothetical protein
VQTPAKSVDHAGILEQVALAQERHIERRTHDERKCSMFFPAALGPRMFAGDQPLLCPHCHAPLKAEDLPSAPLSDAVARALIDHLLLIETELAAIRRILFEEVIR